MAVIEQQKQEIQKAVEAEEGRALAHLDSEYSHQRDEAVQVKTRDRFENAADYEARVAKVKDAVIELDRNHLVERNQVILSFAGQVAAKTQELNSRIASLKERKFPIEGVTPEFSDYDSDRDRLMARISGEEYWFAIPRDRARDLYGRWNSARVEQAFDDDAVQTRWLADTDGTIFPGVPKTIAEDREARVKRVGGFVAIRAGE